MLNLEPLRVKHNMTLSETTNWYMWKLMDVISLACYIFSLKPKVLDEVHYCIMLYISSSYIYIY